MNDVITVLKKFEELSGVPVDKIFRNQSAIANIDERINKYGLQPVLNGMEVASKDLHMQSPEKFNIPYIFAKGKMEHWIYLANKRAARKAFKWEIPKPMKHPQFAQLPV